MNFNFSRDFIFIFYIVQKAKECKNDNNFNRTGGPGYNNN